MALSKCRECGTQSAAWMADKDLCGPCHMSKHDESKGIRRFPALVGMIPRTRGRVDVTNPQKDTLRAIEYMAKTNQTSGANLKRWADQARATLPDKDTKIQPDYDRDPGPRLSCEYQVSVRQAEGEVKALWDKAKYERGTLKLKPTTEIQKRNYDMVDAVGEL